MLLSNLCSYAPFITGYPQAQLANAESTFYWERVKFGLKPTLRINQMIVYHGNGPSGPIASVAIKQLYASHYFQTALDLSVCAQDSSWPDELQPLTVLFALMVGGQVAGIAGVYLSVPAAAVLRIMWVEYFSSRNSSSSFSEQPAMRAKK